MLTKFISFITVLLPILEPYGFFIGSTPLSKIVIFLCCLLICVWHENKRIAFPKYYNYFIIYAFSFPILCSILANYYSGILSSFVSIGLYTMGLGLFLPYFDIYKAFKYYRILIYICCFVFIVQEVSYNLVGFRISGLLPFFPVIYDIPMAEFMEYQGLSGRSSSMFLEPSHFAEYLLPYIAINMAKCLKTQKLMSWELFLITTLLLFIQSGTGVLIVMIMYIIYLIKLKISTVKKYILVYPIIIIIITNLFFFISEIELGQGLLERVNELALNDSARISSGTMRIYRGYYVFDEMPFFEKIFGVGVGNVQTVALNSSVVSMFVEGDGTKPMLNVIQVLLVGYGIIGTFLFLIHILYLAVKNSYYGTFIVIAFICLTFMEFFFCSGKMLFYITLSYGFQKIYLDKKNKYYVNI